MITKKAALIGATVLLAAIAYVYFFIISPIGAKPGLEKPALAPGENVSLKHVEWVVNELGGYKLSQSAEVEFTVEGQKFTVSTRDGKVVSRLGAAPDPDMRITAGRDAFAKVLAANNSNAEILSLYNQGAISVTLVKDPASLALKGYKGIYDTINTR